jgi:hypothetical protein
VSDLLDSLKGVVDPALTAEMGKLADSYLDGFGDMFAGANAHVRPAVQAHLAKAASYKLKAVQASDAGMRYAYVEGVADELAAAKTVLVSEATAISVEQAATFAAGFGRVLEAVGSAAKGLISVVGAALVSGAIQGLTGGDGFDPSSIFPGA